MQQETERQPKDEPELHDAIHRAEQERRREEKHRAESGRKPAI